MTIAPSGKSAPSLPTHVHRNRLTPRSAEACRRTGIEPSELLPLPQSAFQEAGQSALVAKLRWERYEELRLDAYQAVRAERERVIADGAVTNVPSRETLAGSASSPTLADEASSTAADMERRVIEKIKKKQQAEIEQMLMFEISQAKAAQDKAAKVQLEAEKEERAKKERELRAKDAAEFRRRQELERKEAEAAAEKEARRRQQKEMQREARRREEEEEAERQRLAELERKEKERVAKQEARRQRQAELLEQQQAEAKKKQDEEHEKELQRMQRMEEKQLKTMEDNAAARAKQQQRIEATLSMQQERAAQQRAHYLKRMEEEEKRREAWNEQKQVEIEFKQQMGREKTLKIKQAQVQMEAVVEAKKDDVIRRESMHEHIKAEGDAARQKELAQASAEKEMRIYARQLKQTRHQRRDEYKRDLMASKIQLEAARTEDLLSRRNAMLVQRREMRSKNSRAREAVNERMEKMRSSSSFDIDEEIREHIHNPDLRELLDRCDERCGGGKVPLDTLRAVLSEMQKEGKLLGGDGH